MTLDTRTFQSIQPKTPLEDQKSRVPINQALQYLSGALQASISAHVSASISVHEAGALHATKPTFLAHKNGSNQSSISSATDVKITFDTEEWDTGNYYNAATSVWTPPAGKYRVSSGITFGSTNAIDNEDLIIRLYRDGANFKQFIGHRGGNTEDSIALSVLVNASGTNAYEIYVFKSAAGDGTVLGVATSTWFCAEAIA